jgi:hypothetical protein
MDELCKHCGGPIATRNPTGTCDHLFWPDNLSADAKRANGFVSVGADELRELLREIMARLALDSEDDCWDVAQRLEIENAGSLWEWAQKAQAALDKTG